MCITQLLGLWLQVPDVEVEYVSAPHDFDFTGIKAEPNGIVAEPSRDEEVEALDRLDTMADASGEDRDADGQPMAGLGATPGLGAPGIACIRFKFAQ